jgi:hypothetical protein
MSRTIGEMVDVAFSAFLTWENKTNCPEGSSGVSAATRRSLWASSTFCEGVLAWAIWSLYRSFLMSFHAACCAAAVGTAKRAGCATTAGLGPGFSGIEVGMLGAGVASAGWGIGPVGAVDADPRAGCVAGGCQSSSKMLFWMSAAPAAAPMPRIPKTIISKRVLMVTLWCGDKVTARQREPEGAITAYRHPTVAFASLLVGDSPDVASPAKRFGTKDFWSDQVRRSHDSPPGLAGRGIS